MNKLSRSVKNELLPLIGIFSFLYPAVLIIRSALFNAEGILFNLLIDFLILFVGFIFLQISANKFKKYFYMKIIISIVGIILGGLLKSTFGDLLRIIFESAIASIFYVVGYTYKIKNNNNYFNDSKYKLAVFLLAIPLIISFYFRNFLLFKPYILILTYIFIAVFILERNRDKLEWAFNQNGVDSSVFNTKIRSYNRKLSLLVFLAIVLVSNIMGIRVIFEYGLKFLVFIFLKLIYYMSVLLDLLMFKTDVVKQQSQNPQTQMMGINKPSLVALIFDILMKALIFYLLYKLLPVILKRLKKIIIIAINYIKKFLLIFNKNLSENNDEYVDSMEILEVSVKKKEKKDFKLKKKRNEKSLNRIVDPIEKIRCMYGILIDKIHFSKVDLKDSDTTEEIYNKAIEIDGIGRCFKEITEIYDIVRYKEEAPGKEELLKAEKNYNITSDIIKKHKLL